MHHFHTQGEFMVNAASVETPSMPEEMLVVEQQEVEGLVSDSSRRASFRIPSRVEEVEGGAIEN